MKTLVIITHPNIEASTVNKTWADALARHPEQFELHQLYKVYPNLAFDVATEQALLAQHQRIIFQFPLHWYSTPFALKKYVDEVFAYGWAFGPGGTQLKGKQVGFAISTGGKEAAYQNGASIASLLSHFTLTFRYCGCAIAPTHLFYGAMFEPTQAQLAANAQAYIRTFTQTQQKSPESHQGVLKHNS